MDFSLEGRKGQPLARVDGSRGKGFNISSTHVHHMRGKKESTLDPPKQNKQNKENPRVVFVQYSRRQGAVACRLLGCLN